VSMKQAPSTPRLACVKPAASVHPEPGSNSSSYNLKSYDRIVQVAFSFLLTSLIFPYFASLIQKRTRVLSIQYVYERVFLFFAPRRYRLKAGAKVQLVLTSARTFSKKFKTFFFRPHCQCRLAKKPFRQPQSFRFGSAKIP